MPKLWIGSLAIEPVSFATAVIGVAVLLQVLVFITFAPMADFGHGRRKVRTARACHFFLLFLLRACMGKIGIAELNSVSSRSSCESHRPSCFLHLMSRDVSSIAGETMRR